MDKRYQIFISSTFSDLKEERNKVMQTIMSLDCIPAGMELFPAMDEEQFEFIKRIIDDCDYYLLIVGARYGSMDENGVSYTEKEYDYAVSKGIPVIAFLHHDISSLPMNKADLDAELRKKLETFRRKVETGRLVQYWKNADDLNAKVAISLPKTIKMFPRIGWVRANLQSNAESLQEMNVLRKENDVLKKMVVKQGKAPRFDRDIADWDEEFNVHFTKEVVYPWEELDKDENPKIEFSYTWLEWFRMIAIRLERNYEIGIFGIFSSIIEEITNENGNYFFHIDLNDLATIKYQFITYGVITKDHTGSDDRWLLTLKGEKLIAQVMCVKTQKDGIQKPKS